MHSLIHKCPIRKPIAEVFSDHMQSCLEARRGTLTTNTDKGQPVTGENRCRDRQRPTHPPKIRSVTGVYYMNYYQNPNRAVQILEDGIFYVSPGYPGSTCVKNAHVHGLFRRLLNKQSTQRMNQAFLGLDLWLFLQQLKLHEAVNSTKYWNSR